MLDAHTTDLFVKRYVERRLARSGLEGGGEVKVTLPLTGVRSVVRVIEIDGRPRAVVRVHAASGVDAVDTRVLADMLVERHGLDAPRLLDVYEGRKNDLIAVVEEYVSGDHVAPDALRPGQIDALADTFARLHAVASPRCGALAAPSRSGYDDFAFGRASNRFRSVRRWAPSRITPADKRRVLRWFHACSRRLADVDAFSLIHDKPNRGNVIWNESDGRFVLVDLATLRYDCPAKDLTQIEHELLGGDAGRIERFRAAYFGDKPSPSGPLEAFHHAYYHLSQCAINCRRGSKHPSPDEDNAFATKSIEHWRHLTTIVDKTPV